jgi:large subunit ribosomal protein L13
MKKTTKSFKKTDVESKWYVVDLDGKVLGRVSAKIASILKGKTKPQYTPHNDVGDYIIAINASKIKLTGRKLEDKMYYRHTGYMGHLKSRTARDALEKKPEMIVKKAVWGMLPRGPLARKMFKKLKVYAGSAHPHEAQKPETLVI